MPFSEQAHRNGLGIRSFSRESVFPASSAADVDINNLEPYGVDVSWTVIRVFRGRGVYQVLRLSKPPPHLPGHLDTVCNNVLEDLPSG